MVHITALNKYYYGDVSKGEVVNQNLISNTASEQWLGGPALSKASHTVIGDKSPTTSKIQLRRGETPIKRKSKDDMSAALATPPTLHMAKGPPFT